MPAPETCPQCSSLAIEAKGKGRQCQNCGFWVHDQYGRTFDERMAARSRYEKWRTRTPGEAVARELQDILDRDRIARRLINEALGGQE